MPHPPFPMPIRAAIFDFDGVIVDSEPLHFIAFQRVLAEEGIALDLPTYEARYLAMDDKACFTAAFADAGKPLSPGHLAELIERKEVSLADDLRRARLFPGAPEFIRMLAARIPLAINSGALRSEIELVLNANGLRDCFQLVVSADDVTNCKPDPEGYRLALARLNEGRTDPFGPEECFAIEDSVHGVASARGAGLRCIAVTNSFSADHLGQASFIVETLVGLHWNDLAFRFQNPNV